MVTFLNCVPNGSQGSLISPDCRRGKAYNGPILKVSAWPDFWLPRRGYFFMGQNLSRCAPPLAHTCSEFIKWKICQLSASLQQLSPASPAPAGKSPANIFLGQPHAGLICRSYEEFFPTEDKLLFWQVISTSINNVWPPWFATAGRCCLVFLVIPKKCHLVADGWYARNLRKIDFPPKFVLQCLPREDPDSRTETLRDFF